MDWYNLTCAYTCSSVDRAMASGAMCGGSIPLRCNTIFVREVLLVQEYKETKDEI